MEADLYTAHSGRSLRVEQGVVENEVDKHPQNTKSSSLIEAMARATEDINKGKSCGHSLSLLGYRSGRRIYRVKHWLIDIIFTCFFSQ
ncbi:unnamed protein product, partial [Hymenolepis diminuta]